MKSLRQFSFLTDFVQTIQFSNQFSLDNLVFQKTQTIQFFLPVPLQYVSFVCKYIYYFSGTTVIKIILFFNWVLINQFLFVQSRKYFCQFSETNIFIVETFFRKHKYANKRISDFFPLRCFLSAFLIFVGLFAFLAFALLRFYAFSAFCALCALCSFCVFCTFWCVYNLFVKNNLIYIATLYYP